MPCLCTWFIKLINNKIDIKMAANRLYPTLPFPGSSSSLVLSSDEEEEGSEEGNEDKENPLEEKEQLMNESKHRTTLSLNDFEESYLKSKRQKQVKRRKPTNPLASHTAKILRHICKWAGPLAYKCRYVLAGLLMGVVTLLVLGEGSSGRGEQVT